MVAFRRGRLRAKSLFCSNICEGVAWICEYSSGGREQRLLRAPIRHNTLKTLLVALPLEYSNVPLPHRFSSKRGTARSVQGHRKFLGKPSWWQALCIILSRCAVMSPCSARDSTCEKELNGTKWLFCGQLILKINLHL